MDRTMNSLVKSRNRLGSVSTTNIDELQRRGGPSRCGGGGKSRIPRMIAGYVSKPGAINADSRKKGLLVKVKPRPWR